MELIAKTTKSLSGLVTMPGSKSQSVRGLIFATLAEGKSELQNVLDSEDTAAAIKACQSLGATIDSKPDGAGGLTINIQSDGVVSTAKEINTHNSGITTRFLLPMLGLRKNSDETIILDCEKQMRARPISPLIEALNKLGMKIEAGADNGYPYKIFGKLLGGDASVDGTTSQYLSALLISLPLAPNDSIISVVNLNERPYVEMTMEWLGEQGIIVKYEQTNIKDVYTIKGKQSYRPFTKTISGDFSSASYFLAAGAIIPGKIEIRGLVMSDPQGDKQLIEILKSMGADIKINSDSIVIEGGRPLRGIKIDCNAIPDLVPTLAVIGTAAEGKTELANVPQARLKETDRIHSMAEGLKKMGSNISELPDGLIIEKSELRGASVHGYGDHRTIMALALAGLVAEGETVVDTAEGINKTFPEFVKLMQSIGGELKIKN